MKDVAQLLDAEIKRYLDLYNWITMMEVHPSLNRDEIARILRDTETDAATAIIINGLELMRYDAQRLVEERTQFAVAALIEYRKIMQTDKTLVMRLVKWIKTWF